MPKTKNPEKKKILMIEDDIFLRKIYRDKLTKAGFEFIEATNGEEGMDKVLFIKPDLILLDLMLPKKNGFDVLFEIQGNPSVKNIPVIILSNLGQEADINKGLSMGAVAYLIKSEVSLTEVVDKVKEKITK
ncbi:MAG: response regulator [Candidatus Parcubacteria bacterium]|nr:response regulator [Candidatus Parcubacteria bacterium]